MASVSCVSIFLLYHIFLRFAIVRYCLKAKDNRTPEENELIALSKCVKELEMEADILKQAALIIA